MDGLHNATARILGQRHRQESHRLACLMHDDGDVALPSARRVLAIQCKCLLRPSPATRQGGVAAGRLIGLTVAHMRVVCKHGRARTLLVTRYLHIEVLTQLLEVVFARGARA